MRKLTFLGLFILVSLSSLFANERIVKRHFLTIADEVNQYYGENLTDEEVILTVSQVPLVDNRGSAVDAIGVKGRITLFEDSWVSFYRSGVDVRLLVLHELLRANGIDDDNYRVSLPIMNGVYRDEEKNSQRRDKIPFCPLHISDYKLVEKTRRLNVEGFGPQENPNVFIYPNPNVEKAISNALQNGQEKCIDKGYDSFSVQKYGNIENRSQNTNGFKKSFLKVKVFGQCHRMDQKKKRRRGLRKERCEKAQSCLDIIQNYPYEENKLELEKASEEMMEDNC